MQEIMLRDIRELEDPQCFLRARLILVCMNYRS
jgi:hypothetical protein